MYKHAEDPIFDIDILKYAEIEKKREYEGHRTLKDQFRDIEIKQTLPDDENTKRRSLPRIEVLEEKSCYKEFCSSYWYLLLFWVVLVGILCTSVFLFVKCEMLGDKYKVSSLAEASILNTSTRIPTWEDLTETTRELLEVTTAGKNNEETETQRPTYFPARLEKIKDEKDSYNDHASKDSDCFSGLFLLIIIISSFGILFVIIFAILKAVIR